MSGGVSGENEEHIEIINSNVNEAKESVKAKDRLLNNIFERDISMEQEDIGFQDVSKEEDPQQDMDIFKNFTSPSVSDKRNEESKEVRSR